MGDGDGAPVAAADVGEGSLSDAVVGEAPGTGESAGVVGGESEADRNFEAWWNTPPPEFSESEDDVGEAGDAESSEAAADRGESPGLDRETAALVERARRFEPLLRDLEENGLGDARAVQARFERQRLAAEAESERERALAALQARVASGELTEEQAYGQFQATEALRAERQGLAVERAEAQRILAANQELVTARAFDSHKDAYPELAMQGGREVVFALAQSGFGDVGQLAPLLGQILRASGERAVADYVAKQGQDFAVPEPVGAPGNAPISNDRAGVAASWSRLLGIR